MPVKQTSRLAWRTKYTWEGGHTYKYESTSRLAKFLYIYRRAELEFVNGLGTQESIPPAYVVRRDGIRGRYNK